MRYKLVLHNRSVKPEKQRPTCETFSFELVAENDQEYAHTMVTVTMYPEGLAVRGVKFDKLGYAQIGAYADAERAEGGEEVLATRLNVELAVGKLDEKGIHTVELVDVTKAGLEFGKLKGSDAGTKTWRTCLRMR